MESEDDEVFGDAVEKQDPEETESLTRNKEWRSKDKHIFVLSEAGKPIYCRHGSEDQLVSLYGVMQAK